MVVTGLVLSLSLAAVAERMSAAVDESGVEGQPQSVVVAESDADVILPPPTASNPLPSLSVALQRDNYEQLSDLLSSDPLGSDATPFQVLIFANESIRTLLLRHVLIAESKKTNKKPPPLPKKDSFNLPREFNIVATEVIGEPLKLPDTHQVVTYFLRPEPMQAQNVVQHLKQLLNESSSPSLCHYRIVVLPDVTAFVRRVFEVSGILGKPHVSLQQLSIDIFPLEPDLLSLEYSHALTEAVVDQMPSVLVSSVARSLLKLQDVVGTIPRLQAFGNLGQAIMAKMLDLRVDEYLNEPEVGNEVEESQSVSGLVIVDRQVDYVTPLLSPLTYQGLLDDLLDMDVGHLNVKADIINPPEANKSPSDKVVALALKGSDSLFSQVRDQHVEQFGSFLQNQAKVLQASHAAIKNSKRDLQEIHQFVRNIPALQQNLQALTHHIHLAELVKKHSETPLFRQTWQMERSSVEGESILETIEEWIATQVDVWRVLRLLCLQSLCAGGIKSGRYDALRRDIVQTYGYEYLIFLDKLESAGLLRRREGLWDSQPSSLATLRKHLHLIHADVDTTDPDDVSYVSSGYAPLSVRLVQATVKGLRPEVLSQVKLTDVRQEYPPRVLPKPLKPPGPPLGEGMATDDSATSTKKKTLIVCYVGGVTFMEIAALRFLSKRPSFPFHVVVMATNVTNGSKLLKSMGVPSQPS